MLQSWPRVLKQVLGLCGKSHLDQGIGEFDQKVRGFEHFQDDRLLLGFQPERVAHNGFNQIKGAQRYPAIRGDPVAQILAKFWVKDRIALIWTSGPPPR